MAKTLIYFLLFLGIALADDSLNPQVTCSGPTSLNFYGKCVSACPRDSGESSLGFAHKGYCVCNQPKIKLPNSPYCTSAQCPVTASLNFFGTCVRKCPDNSDQTTFRVPHPGFCNCNMEERMVYDGKDCVADKCIGEKNFFGRCFGECPAGTSEGTSMLQHAGYCTCPEGNIPNRDRSGCMENCVGETPVNFYGTCMAECPAGSSQMSRGVSHPGYCICGEGRSMRGRKCSCPAKEFYSKCLNACPDNSSPNSEGACICGDKFEKSEDGEHCTDKPSTDPPKTDPPSWRKPRARITGGDQTFRTDQSITLSGKESINRNTKSGLSYKWECYTLGAEVTFSLSSIKCPNIPEGTKQEYTISPNKLDVGIYAFKLTVILTADDTISNFAMTRITLIKPGVGPLVKIIGMGPENVINNFRTTTLQVEFKGGEEAKAIKGAKYEWTIAPKLPSSKNYGRFFTIQKNTLTADTEYTLKCKVTLNDQSTEVSTTFTPAKGITIGTLTCDKKEGIGYDTKFTFTAAGFAPGVGEADSLKYKFAVQIVGKRTIVPLNPRYGSANRITIDLPMGRKENDYKVKVIVRAENVLKMTGSKEIEVKVRGKENGYSSEFVSERLKSSTTTDEKIVSLGQVAALGTEGKEEVVKVDRKDRDKCLGRCSTTNGKCNSTRRRCECNEGFAPPYCTLNTAKQEENKKILRTVATEVDTLLDGDLPEEEALSLLSVSTECSEGATMGDKEANKKLENIERKLVNRFVSGLLKAATAGKEILRFISNSMGGLDAEGESAESSGTDPDLGERKKERVKNLKTIAKLFLREVPVGTVMEEESTESFELTGMVDSVKSLYNKRISTSNGPEVELSDSIGGGEEIFGVNYLNLLTNPHTADSTKLLGPVLSLELTDHASGDTISVKEMPNPVRIRFQLTEDTETDTEANTGDTGGGTGGTAATTAATTTEGESPAADTDKPKETETCVYWNEETSKYSKQGIETADLQRKNKKVTCNTNHMSEFTVVPFPVDALLQDKDNQESSSDNDKKDDDDDSHSKRNLIIGIVVGLLVLLILAVIAVCYFKKRVYIYIYILCRNLKELIWIWKQRDTISQKIASSKK